MSEVDDKRKLKKCKTQARKLADGLLKFAIRG